MLKIKNNVDLKELENFGFKDTGDIFIKYIDNYDYEYNTIHVMKSNRTIKLGHYQDEHGATYTFNLDTLYDLIQAGLVEK